MQAEQFIVQSVARDLVESAERFVEQHQSWSCGQRTNEGEAHFHAA